jgi:hypothetical protein
MLPVRRCDLYHPPAGNGAAEQVPRMNVISSTRAAS